MALAVSEALVEFLQRRAGTHLRSVIHYTPDAHTVLYLRDDVSGTYTEEEIEHVVEDLRWESITAERQEDLYVHGALGCTLRCFEKAVEIHFSYDDLEGTAVALDAAAATQLNTFVKECLRQIPEEHRALD